jgi:thiol-disulfide isomerase/thioredoxin
MRVYRAVGITLSLSLTAGAFGVVRAAPEVAADAVEVQHPTKAICQTCAAHGSDHGKEDVEAMRVYEGTYYYFCNKSCAESFDSFPTAYVPQPVPRPATEHALISMDGEPVTIGAAGTAQLIDFWATWCKPCTESMPELNELHAELSPSGIDVVGVSIDEKGADHVAKYLKKHAVDYPIVIDNPEAPAWYSYAVAAIPAMFLVDAEGNIVGEWRGEVPIDEVRARALELVARP